MLGCTAKVTVRRRTLPPLVLMLVPLGLSAAAMTASSSKRRAMASTAAPRWLGGNTRRTATRAPGTRAELRVVLVRLTIWA